MFDASASTMFAICRSVSCPRWRLIACPLWGATAQAHSHSRVAKQRKAKKAGAIVPSRTIGGGSRRPLGARTIDGLTLPSRVVILIQKSHRSRKKCFRVHPGTLRPYRVKRCLARLSSPRLVAWLGIGRPLGLECVCVCVPPHAMAASVMAAALVWPDQHPAAISAPIQPKSS